MAAILHMPLHSSDDVPSFAGTAVDLCHYLADIEALCQHCQCATDKELIKRAVYYMQGESWDMFSITRDPLAEPRSWSDFKTVIEGVYVESQK